MSIPQADRIAISKKIVNIPLEKANADVLKAQLEAEKVDVKKEDDANRNLMESKNALINGYQSELERIDGNGRNQLSEQDLLDSAERKLNNPFFPNDPTLPLPNIPDGVWKFFVPFSGTAAIGKNFDETYDTVTKEQDLIDDINAKIATVESFVDATRSTGEECVGQCTGETPAGSGTDQPTCIANGGTWSEIKQASTAMIDAGNELIAAVQAWEDFLNDTDAIVVTTDADSTRSAQNTVSKSDIANAISVIDTWQSLQDYDTATTTPSSCASFVALNSSSFQPSKFRDVELNVLKAELAARPLFLSTRESQLNTNLGSINQDFNTGELLGGAGFYLERFRFIDMRLNAVGGTLSNLKGLEQGQQAQDQTKAASENAELALSSVMTATALRSPTNNNKIIHVLDASGFSPSDSAYVVSENQQEIPVTIQSIDGNTVFLDKNIPEKYRHTEFARLYKVL